jgi:hypothetical protein
MYLRNTLLCLLTLSLPQAGPSPQSPPAAKPQSATTSKRPRVVTKLDGFELMDTGKMEKQTTVAGASRGPLGPDLIAPRLARLYSTEPPMTWTFDGPTEQAFTVRVYNEDEDMVHETTVHQRVYRYGAHGPSLKAGKTYYWTVEVAGAPESRSALAGLKVLEGAERARIATQLEAAPGDAEAAHLARAAIFVQHRLWYDALGEYDAAIASSPTSAVAHEGRGELLAQLPSLQALADAEFTKADALGRGGH